MIYDRAAGFFDIGGDSFAAIEVVERINREFGCSLRPTSLFAHPSVAAMARHLTGLLPAGQAVAGQAPAVRSVEPEQHPDPRPATPAADDASLDDAIAVIGISCRFPGAMDHRAFWSALAEGRAAAPRHGRPRNCVRSGYGGADHPDPRVRAAAVGRGRQGGVQRGVLRYLARDAEFMDPQARLLLQHMAGIGGRRLPPGGRPGPASPRPRARTSTRPCSRSDGERVRARGSWRTRRRTPHGCSPKAARCPP
ncbi:Amino acid adenylation domain-containing protein OS=Streptomyces microflavus OX=1919 GN=Smic_82470 PE=4 SV=1 [Streptomyces microflavus]